MEKNKEKKKTLTISSGFKKKIDTSSFQKREGKKSFSISNDKKRTFKGTKNFNKASQTDQQFKKNDTRCTRQAIARGM